MPGYFPLNEEQIGRLPGAPQGGDAVDAFADQVIDNIGQDLFLEVTLFVQRGNEVRKNAVEFAVAHPFLLLFY